MMTQTNDRNIAYTTDEVQEMPEEKKKPRLIRGRGEVILAIEDEEMLRDVLSMILIENGYKVIFAADGREGLQIYMERMNEIDLVLLDMGLPGMSGDEVLSRIVSASPNAKVISVSGSVDPDVQAGALQMGAADYLPKPYMMGDLLLKVDRTLRGGAHSTI